MSIEDSHCQMGKKISVLTIEADGQATFTKTGQCQKIKEITLLYQIQSHDLNPNTWYGAD